MEPIFHVNPQLDIPIYQQLVDMVRAGVKKGTFVSGQQLPTVQELAQQLSIARGTIKRAYDELEHLGILEKIQGRGTFISYQPSDSGSRMERAVAAIDSLLDELEEMGFSPKEIGIYLNLKQRERMEKHSVVKVAALECNPENLSQMSEQLRTVPGIELYSYLLEGIQDYPYKLDEEMDLVITTATHADFVEGILSDRRKLVRVALRLSAETLSGIVRLGEGQRVGILTCSSRFGDLICRSCRQFARRVKLLPPQVLTHDLDVDGFFSDKDVVLVPKHFEKYCTPQIAEKLRGYKETGRLIPCDYYLDDGSSLYLAEKLRQLRQEKIM